MGDNLGDRPARRPDLSTDRRDFLSKAAAVAAVAPTLALATTWPARASATVPLTLEQRAARLRLALEKGVQTQDRDLMLSEAASIGLSDAEMQRLKGLSKANLQKLAELRSRVLADRIGGASLSAAVMCPRPVSPSNAAIQKR